MRGMLVCVVVAAIAPVFQAPATVPLRRFPAPVETKIGSNTAWCIEISPQARACDAEQPTSDFLRLLLVADGRETTLADDRWGIYRGMFSVVAADLDADGSEELIVVDHVATSNGMAMTLDRVSVVSGYATPAPAWISFNVAEYGNGSGTFVTRSNQPGAWIFATEWARSETLDPERVQGSYVVGRWLRYAKGKLTQEPGVLVRRLLNSLVEERAHDIGRKDSPQPYSWFLNGKGRVVERDPALGNGKILETKQGRIDRVTAKYASADFDLRLDDGGKLQATFDIAYGEQGREHIDHVGVAGGRILPEGVLPGVVMGDVVGRPIRLVRYADGKTDQRVLWID